MADALKTFLKKNSDRVPPGEQVLGAIIGAGGGEAWKHGMRVGAGGLIGAVAGAVADRNAQKKRDELEAQGDTSDAANWPPGAQFWLVLTDRNLHVFQGTIGSSTLGQSVAFGLDRIANHEFDKKMMISKLTINFKDGSSVKLDIGKQKTEGFLNAFKEKVG